MTNKLSVKSLFVCIILTMMLVMGLTACNIDTQPGGNAVEPKSEQKNEVQPVSIKFFSHFPDRSTGLGKLEQLMIDNYMKKNKNVTIEVEALQDEPYKQKFKAYLASDNMPDICMVHGQPAFLEPVMKEGYLAELDPSDYEDYGFLPGSLDGFSYDDKLYALPRSTDVMLIYYNKNIFKQYGVKVPETFNDLVEAAKAFIENEMIPLAMDGRDKWPLAIFYQDVAQRVNGNRKLIYDAINRDTTFAEEESFLEAAEYVNELVDNQLFQKGFIVSDYAATANLFTQEKAAMYYMGSWEMGIASNPDLSESFRENIGVITLPVIEGGKGKVTDLIASNNTGYAVSEKSKVKGEVIELLNYIFEPENWAKNAWQMGVAIPGQVYDEFLTGNETQVQKEVTKILSEATSISGTLWYDSGSPSLKSSGEILSQELAAGIKTPEEFIKGLDAAADKEKGK